VKLTILSKLKNHIIHQCRRSSCTKLHTTLPLDEYEFIKKVLTYEGMMEIMGWVRLVHIDNTNTIMLSEDHVEQIVKYINENNTSTINFVTLHSSHYQKTPECITVYYLTKLEDLVGLLQFVSKCARSHNIRKTCHHRKTKQMARYNGAVRKLQEVRNAFIDNKRLLCIDVESFEYDHSKIIEIGFCVWHNNHTVYHHYVVAENAKYRNSKFVPDNREHFLFGVTSCISMSDIMVLLINEANKCDYVVGHAVDGDIAWLSNHGYTNTLNVFDTSLIARCIKDFHKRTPSLKDLIIHFGESPDYLHNGGNDAAYTMSVLKSMSNTLPYMEIK